MFKIIPLLIAIKIFEVLPNPEGADLNKEYIILKNESDYRQELTGLFLDDQQGESPPFNLESYTIAPLGELQLFSSETKISINNDYDEIRILSSNPKPIDTMKIENALEGETYPLGEIKEYQIFPTTVQITEVMPNPEENESTEEWIEIKNTGQAEINLEGLLLDDNEDGSSPWEIPTTKLEPGERTIIFRSESGIALNNSSDSARILTPDGNILSEVPYESTKEGVSYQLITIINLLTNETEESWQWHTPTPGTLNATIFATEGLIETFESNTLEITVNEQIFSFQTSNLNLSQELANTIFTPEQNISLTFETLNGENEIIDYRIETVNNQPETISIEHEKKPLYNQLLPYLTTILAVIALSIYENKKKTPSHNEKASSGGT